ncbi:uncharacterized protein TRAVEDRAFT_53514 [Trametes versicolor FP-101664 SS1]|uniref:uncharacterized protein n=1 Tax=Trametes versicolor (strain FP-101664) TaxID=717944 RepID=UPI000462165B|nr:uncharacterized protein TRAVEDRAFT_53514 [Trametes versicolor FP-101664 SS1]EIW53100.1 hypothetical protein TRAVEDRAFT_53514 [Trametes versicolor FP-101664 SS1]
MRPVIIYSIDPPRGTPEETALVRALRTIVLAIHTAAPDPRRGTVPPEATEHALSTSRNLVQLNAQTPRWPPDIPPGFPSLNVAWLKDILANGLPAVSTAMISLDNTEDDWYAETLAGLATGHVVSHLGFIPIPSTDLDSDPASFSFHVHPLPSGRANKHPPSAPKMDERSQRDRALWHARRHAFNLECLSPWRNWGPYLAVLSEGGSSQPSEEDEDPGRRRAGRRSQTADVPRAEALLPDWSWLGAARMVAECTLRAHESPDNITRLEVWDNLREGAWLRPAPGDPSEEAEGSEEEDGDVEYDWAGVEGVWRRLVCWLDYGDLIRHNRSRRFDNPHLEEAWIIVPLSLRITGYSPSPNPVYADRPTIHVEGEMGGAGWDGNVDLADEDVRRVHGSVSMLVDGSVRWCITSLNEDNGADEWASEAIQLGGVGSAMGMLGMWTGARHEEEDPIGVIWQWRVS